MQTVLLLEDDGDLREAFALALIEMGAQQVLSVASLDELKTHHAEALACTIAVLDVNLGPHAPTGIDAARWLRQVGFVARLIFLTGHAGSYPDLRRVCTDVDAVLLEKPASMERIQALLEG